MQRDEERDRRAVGAWTRWPDVGSLKDALDCAARESAQADRRVAPAERVRAARRWGGLR